MFSSLKARFSSKKEDNNGSFSSSPPSSASAAQNPSVSSSPQQHPATAEQQQQRKSSNAPPSPVLKSSDNAPSSHSVAATDANTNAGTTTTTAAAATNATAADAAAAAATPPLDIAPKYPQLSADVERYYYGASYTDVNNAHRFLLERNITQFPSSVFSLAATYPPLANSLFAIHEGNKKFHLEREKNKKKQSKKTSENSSTTKNSSTTMPKTSTSSDFHFLAASAEAFALAAANGQAQSFLIGTNLSVTLGLGGVGSPTTLTAPSIQSNNNANAANNNNIYHSPTVSFYGPTSAAATNSGNGVVIRNAVYATGTTPCSSETSSPTQALSVTSSSSPTLAMLMTIPKDPFWLFQTALVDLAPNVSLGRDKPTPPKTCLTPAQFWALHEQIPITYQRKRWRQIYNSRDHGFNISVMRRLCQDQIRYGDKPCVLVMSTQTPDQINAELACALQLASLPQSNDDNDEKNNKNASSSASSSPRYRPPTVAGAFFSVSPFRDGYVRKYFGQEGTFVFRSPMPAEEEQLMKEEARNAEAAQLRAQEKNDAELVKAILAAKASLSNGNNGSNNNADDDDNFTTRSRGFSFAPAAQLIPPCLASLKKNKQKNTSEDVLADHNNKRVVANLTVSATAEEIVREATEEPLSHKDFALKFFKIPPREDGPELSMLAQNNCPQSSAFRPMLMLLAKRLEALSSGDEGGNGDNTNDNESVLPPSAVPLNNDDDGSSEQKKKDSDLGAEEKKTTKESSSLTNSPSAAPKQPQRTPMATPSSFFQRGRGRDEGEDEQSFHLIDAIIRKVAKLNKDVGIEEQSEASACISRIIAAAEGSSSSTADDKSSLSENAPEALLLTLFPPFRRISTRSNDYFIRYTDQQLFCGGGGEGPTIMLSEDCAKATSYPQSDTFGTRKSMREARKEDDIVVQRVAVLLKLLARAVEANEGNSNKTQDATANNGGEDDDDDEVSPIPTTEAEMDAVNRIINFYAGQLQQRRSRCSSTYYGEDESLFTHKWAAHRRHLMLPTLLEGFALQQAQQRMLQEVDAMCQVREYLSSSSLAGENKSEEDEDGPADSEAAAAAGIPFTKRKASNILANLLNTQNDASGPFSLPNLDAFFSITAADNQSIADLHFGEQVVVECGVSEAQIQTVELWEVTDETF